MNDPEASQEYRSDIIATVTKEVTFGQTITARRQPISSLQFWYQIDKNTAPIDGVLIVDAYKSPDDLEPISSYFIKYKDLITQGAYTVAFNFGNDPVGQNYYLEFSTNKGEILILGRGEDAYPLGSAYINKTPIDADMSFRLSYLYNTEAILSDIFGVLKSFRLYATAVFILLVPGYLLLRKINISKKLSFVEIITLSIGITLALYPVIMLWSTFLNIKWGITSIKILFIVLGLIFLVIKLPELKRLRKLKIFHLSYLWKVELLVIAIFILALFIRIAMIRDLFAPAWVDSVHHALIINKIVEQGQFPESYQPLNDITTSNYHPGYHTLISIFQWITENDIKSSMLLMGQILNAVCVLGSYVLTVALTKNRIAGLFAAIVTGFITPMPAYYTSWGRYTQLTGLLILPAAYIFTTHLIQNRINNKQKFTELLHDRKNAALIVLTAIIYAGLFLTHYRVSAFFACLIVAFSILLLIQGFFNRQTTRIILALTITVMLLGLAAVLITSPWWPDTVRTLFIPRLEISITEKPALFNDFSWAYLTPVFGQLAMILAGIGLLFSVFQKKLFGILLIMWIFLMYLIANLNYLGFPGAHFVNNTSVTIIMFIPISILSGYLITEIVQIGVKPLKGHFRSIYILLVSAGVISAIILGAIRILPILNPTTLLYREADSTALYWLDRNLPDSTRIVTNPFQWGYGMYAGNDGGYWITPITNRLSFPPPALYGLSATLSSEVNQISQTVIDLSDDVATLHDYLVDNDIDYIFIGARGGVLSPDLLSTSSQYDLLYKNNGTWIFKILHP